MGPSEPLAKLRLTEFEAITCSALLGATRSPQDGPKRPHDDPIKAAKGPKKGPSEPLSQLRLTEFEPMTCNALLGAAWSSHWQVLAITITHPESPLPLLLLPPMPASALLRRPPPKCQRRDAIQGPRTPATAPPRASNKNCLEN